MQCPGCKAENQPTAKFCFECGTEHAQTGHGQIVAAMADPGVGKSRLFYEFKAIEGGAGRASIRQAGTPALLLPCWGVISRRVSCSM
jgi:hypothetical protein